MGGKSQEERLLEMMKRPRANKRVGIVHLQMVKESQILYGTKRFTNPRDAVEMIKPLIQMADRELFLVMSLSTKLEPLALEIAAVGSVNACGVNCREVFKHSILNNAACIVCFHNHPSGYSHPSREDRLLTDKIERAGALLDITLIDHIIIGGEDFYSFKLNKELVGYRAEDVA